MGCQKEIAKEIIEADADYVLALKGNHATIHKEIGDYLDNSLEERQSSRIPEESKSKAARELAEKETVDGSHGRIETRRYYQSDQLDWFQDRGKWEGLRSVGMVESIREISGKVQTERRYYLSSLPLGISDFARAVRCHRGIENKLHWVLVYNSGRARAELEPATPQRIWPRCVDWLSIFSRRKKQRSEESGGNNLTRDGIMPICSTCSPFRCVYAETKRKGH